MQAGYPFIPTDQPWHRDAVVFGTSGMPWSLRQPSRPQHFELPNAHAANQAMVRVDVHESLGATEARDLVVAVKKVAAVLPSIQAGRCVGGCGRNHKLPCVSVVSSETYLRMNAIVAVITPTKNRLKLLCETMDSVQRQSFDAWEYIVVDDGSDDRTSEEVTRRMAADSRIRYIQRTGERSGANVCRNIGIGESSANSSFSSIRMICFPRAALKDVSSLCSGI